MEKLKLHTPDLTAENIEKLAALFPNCVTEAKDNKGVLKRAIDFDQLRQELSDRIVDGPRERYHLDWPGKREALLAANAPIAKTLRPCREESVDFDSTKNLFVEGDNLDALKLLQETYLGRVKVIYIDPPYNVDGDFVYDDDFGLDSGDYFHQSNQTNDAGARLVANMESQGRFHSKWLTMMYSRLKLSRNLIASDGVIFISIDDKECGQLFQICDEIFGDQNFVGLFARRTKSGGGSASGSCAVEHDYVLAFTNSVDALKPLTSEFTPEYLKRYKEKDADGPYFWDTMERSSTKTRPYVIEAPDGSKLTGRWFRSEVTFKEDLKKGEVRIVRVGDGWSVQFKQRLSDGKKFRSLLLDANLTENKFRSLSEELESIVGCSLGQPPSRGFKYAIDPGRAVAGDSKALPGIDADGFANDKISIPHPKVLENIQNVQRRQNLNLSQELKTTPICDFNLDVEMETGTGKTYCYIKTMFELNREYGWSKFIVVVPSIAIREGVLKSFEVMSDHFQEQYGKRARHFVYNSKQLHNLESFSSDAGINVMIINVQAFNARGEDARRIYLELDDFQSRRPIDVIKKNRPILILDEPQKMEGKATTEKLAEFDPLMILRYSATHKTEHNKVYRLDAIDAYNQKIVKKIAVRGITVKGLAGTNAYLYLESVKISTTKPPEARAELEIQQKSGIKRVLRMLRKNDNLYDLSDGLEQYRGFVVSDINAIENTISFTNGVVLGAGEATGDVNESSLRRIQIREAIKAHFEKEKTLFVQGIKVLSLFFIDEVAKYRSYNEAGEQAGEYAKIFEEEYNNQLNEVLTLEDTPYNRYLKGIQTGKTHNGYFSIDKKTKRLVDPDVKARGESAGEADDVDAYDLILRDKERLLSFEEPVRFLFSHSALREGWDNTNVFVICTLKHSDNTISRRQEVGRGMRLSVNQSGDRIDNPAIVHQVNVLTVVANDSYKDFVAGLQKEISASLSARPKQANEEYFSNKVLQTPMGEVKVTPQMAKLIERYLIKNDYSDIDSHITGEYHEAKKQGKLAPLPAELEPYKEQVFQLIDSVFSAAQLPEIEDDRKGKVNPLNANFQKKEFQELWSRINRKAIYAVDFETDELIKKCVKTLEKELKVSPLQYTVTAGEQKEEAKYEELKKGDAFVLKENSSERLTTTASSAVKYDLIGKLTGATQLTRKTIAAILRGINIAVFSQYKTNPEDFILKAGTLINEQKATVIVEHLAYNPLDETHSVDIFTQEKKEDLSKGFKATRHIHDYVFSDSANERTFVGELDASTEVVVYAKLPKTFQIPTPVGNYSPDWAIVFQHEKVKHIYFVAETKGSMSSMDLRKIEESKIECARKFFAKITSDQVKYDVVNNYGKLMELVK